MTAAYEPAAVVEAMRRFILVTHARQDVGVLLPPTTVDDAQYLLQQRWEDLANDCSALAMSASLGYLMASWALGLISDAEYDGWVARFERCPDTSHQGGRVWCAYCGVVVSEDIDTTFADERAAP
jgi:hypothetical protein